MAQKCAEEQQLEQQRAGQRAEIASRMQSRKVARTFGNSGCNERTGKQRLARVDRQRHEGCLRLHDVDSSIINPPSVAQATRAAAIRWTIRQAVTVAGRGRSLPVRTMTTARMCLRLRRLDGRSPVHRSHAAYGTHEQAGDQQEDMRNLNHTTILGRAWKAVNRERDLRLAAYVPPQAKRPFGGRDYETRKGIEIDTNHSSRYVCIAEG